MDALLGKSPGRRDGEGRARWARPALLATAAAALLVLLPGQAAADVDGPLCDGKVLNRAPTEKVASGRPPVVIGDSIAGWAVPALRNMGFRTNTANCRSFASGVKKLAAIKKSRKVPKLVIMQVGTGGKLKMKQINRARRLIGPGRRLGLVTPREFKEGFGVSKRRIIHQAAERYANVVLFDWDRISQGHPEWFHWDNLHPNPKGATAMAIFFAMIAYETGDPFAPQSA